MRRCFLLITAGTMAVVLRPSVALAGMPSIVLTDWASTKLSAISFFVAVFLLAAAVARWLWNALARDFPKLPQITYRRALAATALWGLMLAVVLTMIAGARELLTPGAWQKRGALYEVAAPKSLPPAGDTASSSLKARREHLRRLDVALVDYATQHRGHYPPADSTAIAASLWEVPGGYGLRYLYVPGQSVAQSSHILAYEPELDDGPRLVLQLDGKIVAVKSEQLRQMLAAEKRS
jgi:hypothetical protein